MFYHLISIDRNRDIMLKVALVEQDLHLPTVTRQFPNANWYERETLTCSASPSTAIRI
ncbi:NADH-quinone oxidoreductase subunit C [Edwardsiella anguillarum]|nr:NADH-quinone oxidoreductase subunit C [Edwardsiella anguillarum]